MILTGRRKWWGASAEVIHQFLYCIHTFIVFCCTVWNGFEQRLLGGRGGRWRDGGREGGGYIQDSAFWTIRSFHMMTASTCLVLGLVYSIQIWVLWKFRDHYARNSSHNDHKNKKWTWGSAACFIATVSHRMIWWMIESQTPSHSSCPNLYYILTIYSTYTFFAVSIQGSNRVF